MLCYEILFIFNFFFTALSEGPKDWLASLGYDNDGHYVHHCNGVLIDEGKELKGKLILTSETCGAEVMLLPNPRAMFDGANPVEIELHKTIPGIPPVLALIVLKDPVDRSPIRLPSKRVPDTVLQIAEWEGHGDVYSEGGQASRVYSVAHRTSPVATGIQHSNPNYYLNMYSAVGTCLGGDLRGAAAYVKSKKGNGDKLVGVYTHCFSNYTADADLRKYILMHQEVRTIRNTIAQLEPKTKSFPAAVMSKMKMRI